jgi:hypothetical protein
VRGEVAVLPRKVLMNEQETHYSGSRMERRR